MNSGRERSPLSPARVAALWRTYPARTLGAAALAVVVAAGIVAVAKRSLPEAAVTAPAPNAVPAPPRTDTVVWRDASGEIYRVAIADGRLDRFLAGRRAAIDAARARSRDEIAAEIRASLKPVFAAMTARVPDYADWYFSYPTRYQLMGHALVPAVAYLSHSLDRLVGAPSPGPPSLVAAINAHMVAYLQEQFAERVVRQHETEIRLQAIFDQSYAALRKRWTRIAADERAATGAFIAREAGPGERVPRDRAAGLKLVWDGTRAGAALHAEQTIARSFRSGLLAITLTVPHSAAGSDAARVKPDSGKADAPESDQTTEVIMNLFDKVVGPVVSQMGDLLIGVVAGGAASGVTVGFGMTGAPMVVATSAASATPIGATIGLAATVVAEMLSNRLEESLSRADFEANLRQSVGAMKTAVEGTMISALDAHVAGWSADIGDPVAVK